MARLFYDTVHSVNRRDYTKEQADAWAPACGPDPAQWNASFLEHIAVVAEVPAGTQIIGFGDISAGGYLDRLYVHKDFQHMGVASAICDVLEAAAGGDAVTVHASITARGFFEKRGYQVTGKQQVQRRGILLTNYAMERRRSHTKAAMQIATDRRDPAGEASPMGNKVSAKYFDAR